MEGSTSGWSASKNTAATVLTSTDVATGENEEVDSPDNPLPIAPDFTLYKLLLMLSKALEPNLLGLSTDTVIGNS